MKILIAVFVVFIAALIALLYKKKNGKKSQLNVTEFKKMIKKAFPKYEVIEKNGTFMICRVNIRHELDELVFIRVNQNLKKNIRYSGRMMIINYESQPNEKQLKTDINHHLK